MTKAFLDKQGICLAPWLPRGADVSPLDIYADPALKQRLRGKGMSSAEKVMEATARALAEMSADPDFLSGLNKCTVSCRPRRAPVN